MEDDKKFEELPIIDKTEFSDDEFIDEIGNKKTTVKIDKEATNE